MMRSIQLPFLMEETLDLIGNQQRAKTNKPGADISKVRLNRHEIEQHWIEIQEHKWFLSERLGRDVGSKVAAIDYFENIQWLAPARSRSFKEHARAAFRRVSSILDKALECDGPNSIANLERMMHGTRSLAK
jgi:hypothetical protein